MRREGACQRRRFRESGDEKSSYGERQVSGSVSVVVLWLGGDGKARQMAERAAVVVGSCEEQG